MIAPISLFTHSCTLLSAGAAATMTTHQFATTFFTNLYLNPWNHFTPVCIMALVVIAATVGLAYLLKKEYDKRQTEAPA